MCNKRKNRAKACRQSECEWVGGADSVEMSNFAQIPHLVKLAPLLNLLNDLKILSFSKNE